MQGGENMCFDPIGAHKRSMITDVRPKLFDGNWKENTGGGKYTFIEKHGHRLFCPVLYLY